MLGLCFIIIGAIIQSASQNYVMLVISRFILGFASPVSQSISPILIAELAYPTHRGKITTACNSVYFMGSTIAAWLVFGCGFMTTDWSWRLPALFQAFTPLVQLSLFWLVPESPRYIQLFPIAYQS
jgi:predicted MFS family arabinose efflux permease